MSQYPNRAAKREKKLFRRMAGAETRQALEAAQWEYSNSGAVRLRALQRAQRSGRLPQDMPIEALQLIAPAIDIFRPCEEPITQYEKPKPGGKRLISVLGFRKYAGDWILRRMLEARFTPHPGQFGIAGRGSKDAARYVLEALAQQKRRWIVTADIRNAFPSAGEEALRTLPIPYRAMQHVYGFGWKSNPGLLQGASASSLALAMILQPMLEHLPAMARTALYVDDFIAVCPSKALAEETADAFMQGLAKSPGDFHPKCLDIVHAKEGFDFLGYEIGVAKNGKVTTRISEKAFARLTNRCEQLALAGRSLHQLRHYVQDWRDAFPMARLRPEDKAYLRDLADNAWLTINQAVAKSAIEGNAMLAMLYPAAA